MKLAAYLSENNLTETAFAQIVGVSQVTINRYVQGKRFPDPGIIIRIETLTGGKVAPSDWYAARENAA
jgi:transcriptional regulator with XRE-family HTH domain